MNASVDDSILVVEDDAEIRESLIDVLEEHGYRAVAARHGLDALDRLRLDGLRPRMILLDLMMPVMDGWTFWAEQQKDAAIAGIPVVVISAHIDGGTLVDEIGGARLLRKPINLDELLRTVRDFC